MEELIVTDRHPMPGVAIYEKRTAPPMEKWFRSLMVLMPVYVNGNSTLVILDTGEMFYTMHRTQSMKQKLLAHCLLSQRELRRACEQDLDFSLHTPLVFTSENRVYATLKMRRPIDRNDGANGYVRLDMIDDARPTSKTTTRLFLTNGMAIDV